MGLLKAEDLLLCFFEGRSSLERWWDGNVGEMCFGLVVGRV